MLAERLGVPFADLDALTLASMGFETVSQAWEAAGQRAFRLAEANRLRAAIAGMRAAGGVLALGGGTPMAPGAEQAITDPSVVAVYLRGKPDLLRERFAGGAGDDRPSLTGDDPIDEIERVFRDRDDIYLDIADHVLKLEAQEEPDATLGRLVGIITDSD